MWSFVKTIANSREKFLLSFSCVFGLQVFFKIYFKIDVHLAHSKLVICVVNKESKERIFSIKFSLVLGFKVFCFCCCFFFYKI